MRQPTLISTRAELDRAIEVSHERPVMIFKHSLACAASFLARKSYLDFSAERAPDDGVLYTIIEIQHAREVSELVARLTGVRHESPQALLLRNREVVWSASHWEISKRSLEEAVSR